MKYLIIIILLFSLIACDKEQFKPYTIKRIGYIYNSVDSTPFSNTKFKIFRSMGKYKEPEEEFFTTDNSGYFNYTSSMRFGSICWPAYFEGAAYLGPPLFINGKEKEETDIENKIITYSYDTLYTTPYH